MEGGKIVVRPAREGEEHSAPWTASDRKLTAEHALSSADEHRARVRLAGVMGGANSEIVGDTADVVLFESANFNGASVRRTARWPSGMRTEACATL